mgnify:CR=1 FL=1
MPLSERQLDWRSAALDATWVLVGVHNSLRATVSSGMGCVHWPAAVLFCGMLVW